MLNEWNTGYIFLSIGMKQFLIRFFYQDRIFSQENLINTSIPYQHNKPTDTNHMAHHTLQTRGVTSNILLTFLNFISTIGVDKCVEYQLSFVHKALIKRALHWISTS